MFKSHVFIAMFVLTMLFLPANSRAEGISRNFGQIYTECGIGAMLFQHQKWAGLAALSNVIWDWGSTASSSALTTPDSCMGGKEERMAAFIYHSYDALERDLAKGYGEHLDTLMALAGKTRTDLKAVESMRQDLAVLVAQGDYAGKTRYQKAEALYNIVEKNSSVS